jgi:hypothetical protein
LTTGQVSANSAILPACLTSNERGCALNKIALASTFVQTNRPTQL